MVPGAGAATTAPSAPFNAQYRDPKKTTLNKEVVNNAAPVRTICSSRSENRFRKGRK